MDANQDRAHNQSPSNDSRNHHPKNKKLEIESIEQSLANLLMFKDEATYRHSNRVAEITAEWVEFQHSRQEWTFINSIELVRAARLHDVGKVGVLDQILQKPSTLTVDEKTQLNLHSEIGYELVRDLPGTSNLAQAIRHHHERWDGAGYPLGLRRDQIPIFAQIISIVDAFDAITSDRPYRKARSREEAIAEIENNAGRQFSPKLSQAFIQFLYARNS